jgi:type IV pilus assembly protein PilP
MMKKSAFYILFVASLASLLVACSGNNSDLVKYIQTIKTRPIQPIAPIPTFAPLPTFKFPENDNRRNPFKSGDDKHKPDMYAPDQKRNKQPLEAFPIDALKFVGVLKDTGGIWALIKDPNGKVTPIRVGDYMGKNYGRIVMIQNNELKLEETIKNSGAWEKKITTIDLYLGK